MREPDHDDNILEDMYDLAMQAKTSLGSALVEVATKQVAKLRRAISSVEDEDVEHVHRCRVCVRRLRTLVRFAEPCLSHPRRTAKRLKEAGRELGRIRDADAQRELAVKLNVPGAVRDLALWKRQRSEEIARVGQFMRQTPWEDWLAKFVGEVEVCDRPLAKAVDKWLGALTEEADALLRKELCPATLHELRIVCKRIRYTAEFFGPALARNSENVVGLATEVQDLIGNWRDENLVLASVGVELRPLDPLVRSVRLVYKNLARELR